MPFAQSRMGISGASVNRFDSASSGTMSPLQMDVYSSITPYSIPTGRSTAFQTSASANLKHPTQFIFTTLTSSMSKRRDQQSRQPGQPRAIAPRDSQPTPPSRSEAVSSSIAAPVRSPRTRLPPRSRSGCWYVTDFDYFLGQSRLT